MDCMVIVSIRRIAPGAPFSGGSETVPLVQEYGRENIECRAVYGSGYAVECR